MAFWLITALIALFVLVALAGVLLRRRPEGDAPGAAYDLQVYRDQLQELDRDLARGTIAQAEAERARVEISRRLLDADRKVQSGSDAGAAPTGATWAAIVFAAIVVLGGGFALYAQLGANRGSILYPDMSLQSRIETAQEIRETRAAQAEAEAELPAWQGPAADTDPDYLALIEKLRAAMAETSDLEGLELLTNHEAQLGNFIAAHQAKARALALKGEAAGADDFAQYADLLVLAAGGYVSPEAEAALTEALRLDPNNPVARYYSGLMFAQIGRPDLGFRMWRDLLEQSAPDALWAPPIRAQIGQIAAMAGVDYTLPAPATAPGPSAEDMAAAADMSPEDRDAMVRGMVDQLSERLATEGGTAQEWARLIGALGVLGEGARAAAIWGEAQSVFAADPAAIALIRAAAAEAGVADAPALPAETRGQDDTNVAAAADMTDDERAAMIQGMVTQLAERLAGEGGTPDEWAQLIGSLGVLGEAERAATIWGEAQTVFAAHPEALATIRAAAEQAGIADTPAATAADLARQERRRLLDGRATDLADTLATSGGPAADWAELITILADLDEVDRAAAVWREAQKVFAPLSPDLAIVLEAARAAGVAE